ncbi:Uncharacterized protein HZ326_12300 [Fusarium oxysporum f. sp. albedinis]|nr:Uncharacterized protein HZ326_12300 [Fusarium oxysporum f. sp. albedinis]
MSVECWLVKCGAGFELQHDVEEIWNKVSKKTRAMPHNCGWIMQIQQWCWCRYRNVLGVVCIYLYSWGGVLILSHILSLLATLDTTNGSLSQSRVMSFK